MRLSRHLALCLPLLLPIAAHAEDIGPAQAQALQQQLKDWLSGLLGPAVKLPDMPWRIVGERDHYVITWPIPGLTTSGGEAATKINVRPLDGTRWSIDSITLPPSGSASMTLPEQSDTGLGGPMEMNYNVGRQDSHGVLDTSLATNSTLHAEFGNLAVTAMSPKQRQEQRFDRYMVETNLKPTANGRLDLTMETTVEGWKSAAQTSDGTPIAFGIQSMRAVGRINGVSRERVGLLLTAVGGLAEVLPLDGTVGDKSDLTPPARAQLKLMLASLQDMFTGVGVEETLDGVQVEVPGMGGLSIKHFQLGFGGEAPNGRLRAWLDMGLDEMKSPSLPPKVATYLPRHIRMKPTLSGILTEDLHRLMGNALDENGDEKLAADAAAIFAHGGVNVGMEALSFDLGPAKFDGSGQVIVQGPDTWHGTAHVVATGFDDLTTQARSNPDLQQAMPVLIMMRGLAKADGQKLVWDIVSDGPTVTVNGLDLSKLGSDEKPKGKPPARKPGQPPSR